MKYIPGPAFGEFRGSQGNTTASRNTSGAYLRNRVTPVNPNTTRQQAVRGIFAALANVWLNTLTQANRDAWNLYAASVTHKDPFGQDIYLTGYNMFQRSNCVGGRAGYTLVTAGPTIFTKGPSDSSFAITASEATQLISVTFDDTAAWCDLDDAGMQVLMTKPVPESRIFVPPTTRLSDQIDGDSVSAPTSPQTMTAPFVITEDQVIQCLGRIILPDGRLSDPFQAVVQVAA